MSGEVGSILTRRGVSAKRRGANLTVDEAARTALYRQSLPGTLGLDLLALAEYRR
jgi:hypothetical protein